jgi:non-specific serine/threonine protein kinase
MPLALLAVVTPNGSLRLDPGEDDFVWDPGLADRLTGAFAKGPGHGLLQLGAGEAASALPPALTWWRDFAARWMADLCARGEAFDAAKASELAPPDAAALVEWLDAAPPMRGGEYLRPRVLIQLWGEIGVALKAELAEDKLTFPEFLRRRDSRWRLVGRVHFNLAENRRDPEYPFAFMATYTSGLGAGGVLRHLPLAQALRESAGDGTKLLQLLEPVNRATESLPWLKQIVDAGEIFHPLRWTPAEALRFLGDVETLERSGLAIRMPANWRMNRPSRPKVEATVGSKTPSLLGMDSLLDFQVEVSIDGESLTPEEIETLLSATDGLALLRGKWIEVDREKLASTIDKFRAIERLSEQEGVPFGAAMRLLAGAAIEADAAAAPAAEWAHVQAGEWLAQTLEACRSPEGLARIQPGPDFHATLRPYQETGLRWLYLLVRMGLGACLADDMGLGKTVQVLALLQTLNSESAERKPSVLVAPASLLANWALEAARFAPRLRVWIAHPSFPDAAKSADLSPPDLAAVDLVVTSYGTVLRQPWLARTAWRLAVLDEAQAIKNPGAKQTRAVKSLKAGARIALTGTPIENNLRDLWSIFDFVNPGLLGSAKAFANFVKTLESRTQVSYAPLRKLTQPYILRRLKSDRSIIADLPDKTEIKAYCALTRKQAALYQSAVDELERSLKLAPEGNERRGLVLASIMRFKQICNHPSQWLGDGAYFEDESGKFARLREIAEPIATRQEKLLVFTQFKEIIPALETLLADAFGAPGLVLHGETPVAKRKDLVKAFQNDERAKFFVLSIKAGGSGLNLTAASHVVHFDRWWNPAVENQATDRAYRIGQRRNVLVHKFVCRGTIEANIDTIIDSKRQLADDFLGAGGEINLTRMSNDEILRLVALDLDAAMSEGPSA